MTFGEKLSKLRKESNYTQEQLAEILEVSRQSVSKWESDIAYPETDKLIRLAKLFECSTDYLLKDECMNKNEAYKQTAGETASAVEAVEAVEKEYPAAHQKVIGCILLAVSLIASVFIWLLAGSKEGLFIVLAFALSILICGLICLLVKQKAGYWCAWAIFAPIVLLTPFTVGFSILRGAICIKIIFYIIMAIVARRCFGSVETQTSSKKSILVVCGWAALLILRIFLYVYDIQAMIGTSIAIAFYLAMEVIVYIGVALLLTYTVCCMKNFEKNW